MGKNIFLQIVKFSKNVFDNFFGIIRDLLDRTRILYMKKATMQHNTIDNDKRKIKI